MRLENYINVSEITYDQYCQALDITFLNNEGVISDFKDKTLTILTKSFGTIRNELLSISQEIGVGIGDVVDALKTKDAYSIMSSVGFNIKVLFRSLVSGLSLIDKGLLEVFKEIHNSKLVQKIHSGVVKVDDVMDRYPILKRVSGPIIAGLLFYIWLNSSFTGKVSSDFDISDVLDAMKGQYNITDIISTPQGLMRLFLTLTGSVISVSWISSSLVNVLIAVMYTATSKSNHPVTVKLKNNISKHMEKL